MKYAPKIRHWILMGLTAPLIAAAQTTPLAEGPGVVTPGVATPGVVTPGVVTPGVVTRGEFQDVAQLEALARAAGAQELQAITDRQRLVVGPVQSHLQLPRCASAVKALIGTAPHMKDRVTVELRCAGPATWHLYVPVRLIGTTPATVTAHAIVIGSVLTANDLRVEQHDVSELPQGYFDDPAVAVGLTAARPISGGAILTNQQLVASRAVQRGQSVTLVANAGGMLIRMAGRAMNDGLVNQRVKVQNLSSGKIVEGVARSGQVVEIIFQ